MSWTDDKLKGWEPVFTYIEELRYVRYTMELWNDVNARKST